MGSAEANKREFFYVVEEPLKLLFVDDDPILREFALVHLASEQGEIRVAADGEEALAAIALDAPDLLLLDLQMPKVDGFEVLRRLRANPATQRLPVIVITGREDVVAIDLAFDAGATSFVVKPVNWRLLSYQIRFLNKARVTEQSLVKQIIAVEQAQSELERQSTELAAALRGAAAASEAKAQFLAAMSHELRTPLNAILGFSELIQSATCGPVGKRYLEYVRDIQNSGAHLLSLINDVLELSRAEAGKLPVLEETFPLSEVLDEAGRMVQTQADAGGIILCVEDARGVHLRADRRRVLQVLLNLLVNGVKFTPRQGRVSLRTELTDNGLAIMVSDTGIGIAEEDIPRALERFGQVDSTLARKYDGAGLGLPLAQNFMEMHQGTLKIQSKVAVGTTVTVTFPKSRFFRGTTGPSNLDKEAASEAQASP